MLRVLEQRLQLLHLLLVDVATIMANVDFAGVTLQQWEERKMLHMKLAVTVVACTSHSHLKVAMHCIALMKNRHELLIVMHCENDEKGCTVSLS